MPSEHQAKATLQTRIEKGKAFKNGPWLPEQSHLVADGRLGDSLGGACCSERCSLHRLQRRMEAAAPRLQPALRKPAEAAQAAQPRAPRGASGAQRSASPRVPQDRPPAAEQLAGQPSLASRRLTPRPRPRPAAGLARLPRPSGPQPRLLSRTHYLPQANVARDGQSEGQCNVLHGLSHGSVQNPANTEVPPTAALRHAGNARGRLRRPGRAIASRARGRNRASERRSRPVVFFLPLLNNKYY